LKNLIVTFFLVMMVIVEKMEKIAKKIVNIIEVIELLVRKIEICIDIKEKIKNVIKNEISKRIFWFFLIKSAKHKSISKKLDFTNLRNLGFLLKKDRDTLILPYFSFKKSHQ